MEVKADFRIVPIVAIKTKEVKKIEPMAEKQKTKREKRGWFA